MCKKIGLDCLKEGREVVGTDVHLRDEVFKLSWQSDRDSFTGSSPSSHIENFY